MDKGIVTGYISTASSEDGWIDQSFAIVDSEYFSMNNHLKDITKKATKNTNSNLYADDVYVKNLDGFSAFGDTESGTGIIADRVEADYINVNNRYEDNLKKNGGYGEVGAEITGSSDDAALTDYTGLAFYEATGEKVVSAQGHLDDQYGHVDSNDRTNGDDSEGFNTGNGFDNYFYGKEASASPWESTLLVGHQTADDETIQQAINLIGDGWGTRNIFLLEKTYYENRIVNNNGYERSFNLLGAGCYLPWAENTVIDADTTGDGVGDGGIIDLFSDTGNRDFAFQNIDFKNGNEIAGGAIDINPDISGTHIYRSFVDVDGCNFINNHATWGGAIYNTGGVLNVLNSNFYSNSADFAGGAIENDQGITSINGGIFQDNSAGGWGGALINVNGQLSTTGVSFINNNALAGGAVSVLNDPSIGTGAQYNSNNDEFNGNGATLGGAIYLDVGTVVNVASGTFVDNEATQGGAVLIDQTGGLATYIDDAATTYSGNNPNDIETIS
jgi:hypothetical protein